MPLAVLLSWISCGGSSPAGNEDLFVPDSTVPADVLDDVPDLPGSDGREDTLSPDLGTDLPDSIEPGGFLAPCSSNSECTSGFCVEGPQGNICTRLCLSGDCPEDFVCSGIVNTFPDVTFICIPKFGKVCSPCSTDTQCGGGRCIETPSGRFCSVSCTGNQCPDPYRCTPLGEDGAAFCLPESGDCLCRKANEGEKRLCQVSNDIGTCYGYESCDPRLGFVGCDARTPAVEECNGIDDDCDGLVDEDLPAGEPCQKSNAFGTCRGQNVCLGPMGLVCNAGEPAEETCNGIDDDCDGVIDQPFLVQGVYGSLEHCGACNRSCLDLFPNATPGCSLAGPAPRCVVVECDPGYYRLNDVQCVPLTTLLCSPCNQDADCVREGARCLPLGTEGGTFCGQACTVDGDCPSSFACLPAPGGPDQCQPLSGTCSCTGASQGVSRGCSVSYTVPGGPSYTCTGMQVCGDEGWGPCVLPEESCNGLDDNCNGTIDEGFLDPGSGRYVDDRNCGVCGNNCAAQNIPNGRGVCDTSRPVPDCKVTCNDGFLDVDRNPANGCECIYLGPVDLPGDGDANCDGIDGELDSGLFVAKWGNDQNPGTIDLPLLTIGTALSRAQASGKRDVYVATGVYSEAVVLQAGIGLYGGYSADFRIREPMAYETVILGPAPAPDRPGAVNAIGIAGGAPESTVLDGFVVIGANNRVPGGNSIAVYLRNSDATVAVRNSRILGGQGGDGEPGRAGASGGSGASGAPGAAARDSETATCGTGNHLAGGAGGAGQCGSTSVSGGDGGTGICPQWDENDPDCPNNPDTQTAKATENGKNGRNNTGSGGAGGTAGMDGFMSDRSFSRVGPICVTASRSCSLCTVPPRSMQGGNGQPGTPGAPGSAGSPCQGSGTVSGGVWVPPVAGNGGDGGHGGGGGGGGAGGGTDTRSCTSTAGYSDIGGSGGGGGAGGCGAAGGTAGGSGGGSFAIFVTFDSPLATAPIIRDCQVQNGLGGDGGNGGLGGVGGSGGTGGVGGRDGAGDSRTFCAAGGGVGGDGGAGGHGGGGGGGCGGPAYGLFVHGATAGQLDAYRVASILWLGTGAGGRAGTGGGSLGNPGADGVPGIAAQTNF